MQRAEDAQTPYEVYCYQCQVTFPVEARRCIHCGERLGPRGESPPLSRIGGDPHGAGGLPGAEAEDEAEGSLLLRRFGGLAVWAVLALSAVLSSLCRGE